MNQQLQISLPTNKVNNLDTESNSIQKIMMRIQSLSTEMGLPFESTAFLYDAVDRQLLDKDLEIAGAPALYEISEEELNILQGLKTILVEEGLFVPSIKSKRAVESGSVMIGESALSEQGLQAENFRVRSELDEFLSNVSSKYGEEVLIGVITPALKKIIDIVEEKGFNYRNLKDSLAEATRTSQPPLQLVFYSLTKRIQSNESFFEKLSPDKYQDIFKNITTII